MSIDPRTLSHKSNRLPEWTEYVLIEVKDAVENISQQLDQKLELEDIQPVLTQVGELLERLSSYQELLADYQSKVDSLRRVEEKVEVLSTHYQSYALPTIASMAEIVEGLNIISNKVDAIVSAIGLVHDGYDGFTQA